MGLARLVACWPCFQCSTSRKRRATVVIYFSKKPATYTPNTTVGFPAQWTVWR